MNQNPRNCRNNCPKYQSADCPAIVFEQTEHLLGFSQLAITVSQVIGCVSYPESVLPPEPVTVPTEETPPPARTEPVKKAAPCPGAPKKKK